jgi:hypothetical protein
MSDEEGGLIIKDRRKGWFRPEFTLGTLIQLLALAVGIFWSYATLDKNFQLLQQKFELYIANQEKERNIRDLLEKIDRSLDRLEKRR